LILINAMAKFIKKPVTITEEYGNNELDISNDSTSILFHGSPIKINDRYMASETYFTKDIEIAKGYGKFVYSIEMDDKLRTIMQLDCLGEHFISTRLIPMYLFNVQEF